MDPLASVDEFEIYLGRTLDDRTQAETILTLASGAVRAYCGWEISQQINVTMYVEGFGTSLMTLPTLCLTAVHEVRADGQLVDPAEYPYKHSRKGQIWGYWVCAVQYEFDVDHGYEPVPDLVKLVTMDLSSKHMTNPEGLTSATVGQVSRTWGNSTAGTPFSPLHAALLDRYSL
jgi:hypothetical protein